MFEHTLTFHFTYETLHLIIIYSLFHFRTNITIKFAIILVQVIWLESIASQMYSNLACITKDDRIQIIKVTNETALTCVRNLSFIIMQTLFKISLWIKSKLVASYNLLPRPNITQTFLCSFLKRCTLKNTILIDLEEFIQLIIFIVLWNETKLVFITTIFPLHFWYVIICSKYNFKIVSFHQIFDLFIF